MSAPWQSFNNIRNEKGRTWKLIITYGLDWIVTVGLTAAFFLLDGVSGYKREFDLTDTSYVFAIILSPSTAFLSGLSRCNWD